MTVAIASEAPAGATNVQTRNCMATTSAASPRRFGRHGLRVYRGRRADCAALVRRDERNRPQAERVGALGRPAGHAAGCIAVDELELAVETQVGRSLFSRPPTDVTVVVKIEQLKPSRWRALVSIRNAQGRVWGNRGDYERPR